VIFPNYDAYFLIFYQKKFNSQELFLHIVVDTNIIYSMDPSTSFFAENRDIEHLRTFVDQTIADAADLRNKFERQEELVETFGEEVNAPGAKLARTRANKLETRLIAAMARQDAAYNRYAATVGSVNKTTVVVSKSAAGKGKETAKTEDGKLLKRKLKEPDEWVDSAGKTHQKHLQAFTSCKSLSEILWRMLDAFRLSMANSGDMEAIEKDVRLGELYTHKALMDRIDEMSVWELLEYALNCVH
jgi:hypothetical protein